MIATDFQIKVNGETSGPQWVALGVPMVICALIGAALAGGPVGAWFLGFIGLCIGAIIGACIIAVMQAAAPQILVTTLESDGVTLWAFNERRPDVQHKGRCKLFALPLDQVGACERGKAYDLFGVNWWLGALRVLHELPVAKEDRRNFEAQARRETTAIIIRTSSRLQPVFAGMIGDALAFDLVGQINRFLADARALNVAAPSSSAPQASGFDV